MIKHKFYNNKKYTYLPDYNSLINYELYTLFLKNKKKCKIIKSKVSQEIIKKSVKNLPMITFELTQNCNLRCKYCIFGGNYKYQREHESKNMKFDVAKKTIDYFYNLFDGKKNKLFITFYGGEPLLNFSLLKKIVQYAEQRFLSTKISYNFATNGVLLKDDVVDYLIEKDFFIRVSLDGPEENHDKNRIFPNGNGSFEIIMENLSNIYSKNYRYFENKLSVGAVISNNVSFKKTYDFFNNHYLFKNIRVSTEGVKTDNLINKRKKASNDVDKKRINEEYNIAINNIIDKIKSNRKITFMEKEIINNYNLDDEFSKKVYHTSQSNCIYDSRIFVDVNGNFHICERGNREFIIGNYIDGFNYKRMEEIYLDYLDILNKKCSKCDYRFLCNLCFAGIQRDGRFVISEGFCKENKKYLDNKIERYIKFKREGVFDYEKS